MRVTLKSGTVFDLDRFAASDFDDGVRVWDGRRGVVDLDSSGSARSSSSHPRARRRTRPAAGYGAHAARRLHRLRPMGPGGVRRLRRAPGHTAGGERSLRFDAIRSIARRSRDSSLVTLLDGRKIVLSGAREVGQGNRGIYVDDPRYGRVLVSWDAFERVEFSPGGSGPVYGDFPPGRPLTGSVTTRDGRRLAGRLVYDLDESESTETLDAPSKGVDYTIPFGLIASIVAPDARARRPARQGHPAWRRRVATGVRRRPRPGECRHADLRRRPSAARVRALDGRRGGRSRSPAGDVPAARQALNYGRELAEAGVPGGNVAQPGG